MRVMKQRGFTVIETMLFLAISTALTIAVIATAGASIGAQRYKDAVATLQSDIQQQYEDAVSIKNQRNATDTLPASCTGAISGRGQTRCILMGKLMTITGDGHIAQYVVYGTEPTSLSETATELDVMIAYTPRVIASSVQQSRMEWETGIAWPREFPTGTPDTRSGTNRDIGILVVRSPRSGTVYTFTKDDTIALETTNLGAMITEPARRGRTICIESNGWVNRNGMSVTLARKASSASAVEVRTNELMGAELQC